MAVNESWQCECEASDRVCAENSFSMTNGA